MTLSEVETVLAVLDPERDEVRLMGGEPTLHSKYPQILNLIKGKGYQVVVFTNGLSSKLRRTLDLPDRILLNLNDWSDYTFAQRNAIRLNLSHLNGLISLGYTIQQPAFDLSMHRRLILEKNLQPMIRLGFAQPVLGGDNIYLPDDDLPAAHQAVVKWAKNLAADGIRLSMDCGFMRCLFDDADIEALVRARTVLNFDCSPTLDVGPGLKVWRCFAFTDRPGVGWDEFEHPDKIQAWFINQDSRRDVICKDCEFYANGWCRGGCLARRVIQADAQAPVAEYGLQKYHLI